MTASKKSIEKYFFLYRMFDYSLITGPILMNLYMCKGLTVMQISILASINSIICIALLLPAGIVSDKYSHKINMLIASIAFTLGELTKIFSNTFAGFAIAIIFVSLGYSLSHNSITAYLFSYIKEFKVEKEYNEIESNINKWKSVKGVIMLSLASLLSKISIILPFVLSTILSMISIPMCMKLPEIHETKSNKKLTILVKDLVDIVLDKNIFVLLSASTFCVMLTRTVILYECIVWTNIGIDISTQATIFMLFGVMNIPMYKYTPKIINMTYKWCIPMLIMLSMLTMLGVLISNDKLGSILSFIPITLSGVLYNGVFCKLLGEQTSKNIKASIFSVMGLLKELSYAVATVIFASIYNIGGVELVFEVLLIFSIIGLVIFYMLLNKLFYIKEELVK